MTEVNFGERIRARRVEKDMSQLELAQRVGRSQSSISQIEAGQRGLDVDGVKRFCRALDMSPTELVMDEQPDDPIIERVINILRNHSWLKEEVLKYAEFTASAAMPGKHIGMES